MIGVDYGEKQLPLTNSAFHSSISVLKLLLMEFRLHRCVYSQVKERVHLLTNRVQLFWYWSMYVCILNVVHQKLFLCLNKLFCHINGFELQKIVMCHRNINLMLQKIALFIFRHMYMYLYIYIFSQGVRPISYPGIINLEWWLTRGRSRVRNCCSIVLSHDIP